tara:strand:- start:6041 stop:6697 length:657 start_codon:yes stop_codon:yes gene_type:complete
MLFVNVGAGRFPEENFVNLDNSVFLRLVYIYRRLKWIFPKKYHSNFDDFWVPLTKKYNYIRHNCLKPLPFLNNSVNHILCSHFLEHVYPNEAEKILNGFYNKLVDGGSLHIIVPDLDSLAKDYLDSNNENAASEFMSLAMQKPSDKPSFIYRFLEISGSFGLEHRWMYDIKNLTNLLKRLNFKIVDKLDHLPSSKHYEVYKNEKGNLQIFAIKNKLIN